jgi:hypothetical protein
LTEAGLTGPDAKERAQEAVNNYLAWSNGEVLDITTEDFNIALTLAGKLTCEEGTYTYIGSDGKSYEYPEPPTPEEITQRENQIFTDRMTGTSGEYEYTD